MAIVRVLDSYESPAARCRSGDFFVKTSSDNMWWVNAWDGRESWDVSGPYGSQDEALNAGREALENITATIAANSE